MTRWRILADQHDHETLVARLLTQLRLRALPARVSPEELTSLPHAPGVYLFYGANQALLYVGKSIDLRSRVASHFTNALHDDRELRISQQTERIEYEQTDGDFSAQLREIELIKARQPLFNRKLRRQKNLLTWQWPKHAATPVLTSQWLHDESACYGLFKNRREGLETLKKTATEHRLCPETLGLEPAHGRCFAYQLGRCAGACQGIESREAHEDRARQAMAPWRLANWSWHGPILVMEGEQNERGHLFDQWCYLGAVDSIGDAYRTRHDRPRFDADIYRLLKRYIGVSAPPGTVNVLPLDPALMEWRR
ncbi:GIY-YIG nuclease family protein [Larsenimonas rhizosphaerae]|uniref:Excinuclease cho n=1 Tax=Larsenimonas rhizosphaerae TaxID=2944682 RepID=A0AA41ZDV9_9GAMM|nr:GIY-YIG nuclease family protein [Larsenimonas rhizosphaerae]MCM2130813.1 GIY-YIG nuclease family protein [Larsenimonas rhizosphaerae]MCX2523517.1 GIY-YIG nuclease family protein [Larsenimonas rhizosphaerae]